MKKGLVVLGIAGLVYLVTADTSPIHLPSLIIALLFGAYYYFNASWKVHTAIFIAVLATTVLAFLIHNPNGIGLTVVTVIQLLVVGVKYILHIEKRDSDRYWNDVAKARKAGYTWDPLGGNVGGHWGEGRD